VTGVQTCALPIFPLAFIATLVLARANTGRKLSAVAILVPAILGVVMIYFILYPNTRQSVSSIRSIVGYESREYTDQHRLGRLAQVRVASAFIAASPSRLSLGAGPGSCSATNIEGTAGVWSTTLIGEAATTDLTKTMAELGVLGLALLAWIAIRLLYGLARLYRATPPGEEQSLLAGLLVTALVVTVSFYYAPLVFAPQSVMAVLFWMSAAYLGIAKEQA
jgi:O-antigen ligase